MPRKLYPSDDWKYRKKKSGPKSSRSKKPEGASLTAAPPLAPAADFKARRAPAPPARALPTLAELAGQEATGLAGIGGGECKGCHAPVGDDDRHCQKCGRAVRRECPSCHRPLRPEQSFCAACGDAAPTEQQLTPAAALVAAPPAELGAGWEPSDMFIVSGGVNMLLVHWDAEPLDDKDENRINGKACAVANKHFRYGGKWKEEIGLGMALAGALWPAAYHYYFIAPMERRAEAEKKARELERTNLRSVPDGGK